MKGEWCYFKSYFSKEQCNDILKRAMEIPSQQSIVGMDEYARTDEDYRRSRIRFVQNTDWRFQDVFDALWKTAISANNDFFDIHITRLNFIQIAEYDSSYRGEYKEHHDVFWMNNDPFYHRKLTCVIQLSDPEEYEGGNLMLTDVSVPPGENDFRAQGTVVFFPSLFRHKATPVTSGTRYSIAAWFEGPKWR